MARLYAAKTGPFRLAFYVMLTGAALLVAVILWRGTIWQADPRSFLLACLNGVLYAGAVASLFMAFSLAPVSIVGPLTAGYPALVVVWGLFTGLVPTPLQWLAVLLIIMGAVVVGRMGPSNGGLASVETGKIPVVIAATILASCFFASTILVGQAAAATLGSLETTFVSRFPAALVLLPFMLRDRAKLGPVTGRAWTGIVVMGALDVVAVTAINASTHYPGKELGAMAISCYGALSVLLAMILLKEKVSLGQWLGIAMTVSGIVLLGIPH